MSIGPSPKLPATYWQLLPLNLHSKLMSSSYKSPTHQHNHFLLSANYPSNRNPDSHKPLPMNFPTPSIPFLPFPCTSSQIHRFPIGIPSPSIWFPCQTSQFFIHKQPRCSSRVPSIQLMCLCPEGRRETANTTPNLFTFRVPNARPELPPPSSHPPLVEYIFYNSFLFTTLSTSSLSFVLFLLLLLLLN